MREWFNRFASTFTKATGSPLATILAFTIVAAWFAFGPMFKFSDSYQLVINTGTTIVTFLMVFLIQNTQNRDAKAMHLKLDELIASLNTAHNEMIDIEDLSDERLQEIADFYKKKKQDCSDDEMGAIAKDVVEETAEKITEKVAESDVKKVACQNVA
jgi:low affinity Fe/Cu permease